MPARCAFEVGSTYGRLTVLTVNGRRATATYTCSCSCGTQITVSHATLRDRPTPSCGCVKLDASRINGRANRTHGASTRLGRTPEYLSWTSMKQRCTNPNDPAFSRYGGSGVVMDPRWVSFEAFLADMGPRPLGTTLDRRDTLGPYTKDNCRWVTHLVQQRNRKDCLYVEIVGHGRMTLTEAAELCGQQPERVGQRYRHGWPVSLALMLPKQR